MMISQSLPGLIVGNNNYECEGHVILPSSPTNDETFGSFSSATPDDLKNHINESYDAFLQWRKVPAPKRGELIRLMGNVFREHKQDFAEIIMLEVGKIKQEALGEVQEVIDICDFAVGLSRQLHGLTIASERPDHRLMEQWHPLGPVGIITAFNFPMAVWAWNATLAIVCGNPVIWKPSEKAPFCAEACHRALMKAVEMCDFEVPNAISIVVNGYADVGAELAKSTVVPLISATGSTTMGQNVAVAVAKRFGRSLLELGGNAAMIITPNADLNLAVKAALFSAIGTCGQRCTSLRRLIVHESIYDAFVTKLKAGYASLKIGDPLVDDSVHVGPIIDDEAKVNMIVAYNRVLNTVGSRMLCMAKSDLPSKGSYVFPVAVEVSEHHEFMDEEVFGPLLYVMKYSTIEQAIELNNRVPQGLSSTIITSNIAEAELFCSPVGSDCGLANVNVGTSGAEIGGAFGGEKQTGGGRESGSDAWKAYMRRQTNSINYSVEMPLAQGVKFEL